MDVLIRGSLTKLLNVLFLLGFEVKIRRSYCEAKLKQPEGRFHIYIAETSPDQIYCDLHFDSVVHFLSSGVDYGKKPLELYQHFLLHKLKSNGFNSEIMGGFDWSTRKNRAIITGLRL